MYLNGKVPSWSSRYPPGEREAKACFRTEAGSLKHDKRARPCMKSNLEGNFHSSSASEISKWQLEGALAPC
jgi:hypothetical protein